MLDSRAQQGCKQLETQRNTHGIQAETTRERAKSAESGVHAALLTLQNSAESSQGNCLQSSCARQAGWTSKLTRSKDTRMQRARTRAREQRRASLVNHSESCKSRRQGSVHVDNGEQTKRGVKSVGLLTWHTMQTGKQSSSGTHEHVQKV